MIFSNKWWFSPTSDGFLQQVMVVPTSDGSPSTTDSFFQKVMVFSNKRWFSQQVMVISQQVNGSSNQ
jgi:hypothetical protein